MTVSRYLSALAWGSELHRRPAIADSEHDPTAAITAWLALFSLFRFDDEIIAIRRALNGLAFFMFVDHYSVTHHRADP